MKDLRLFVFVVTAPLYENSGPEVQPEPMVMAPCAMRTPTISEPAAILAEPTFHQTLSVALALFIIRTEPPKLSVSSEPTLKIQNAFGSLFALSVSITPTLRLREEAE
jgi:hypothetical protein